MNTDQIDLMPSSTLINSQMNPSDSTSNIKESSALSSIPSLSALSSIPKSEWFLTIFTFSLRTFKLFERDNILFELHGFFLVMVLIDLFWNLFSTKFYYWIPFSLFNNFMLFMTILFCALVRIKLFAVNTTKVDKQNDNLDLDEFDMLESEKEPMLSLPNNDNLSGKMDGANINIDIESNSSSDSSNNNIEIKSVSISYLGALVELKNMNQTEKIQMKYYCFPLLFHGILSIIWFIISMIFIDKIASWQISANLYCILMCLLPVPSFDGGALLTIYLKKKKWSKMLITLTLILTSGFVIAVCAIYFVSSFCTNIFLLYLMVIIGIKLFEFVFNRKDDNMNAIKNMAMATKTISEATNNMNIV